MQLAGARGEYARARVQETDSKKGLGAGRKSKLGWASQPSFACPSFGQQHPTCNKDLQVKETPLI